MATKYLINTVRVGTEVRYAGESFDTVNDAARIVLIEAAGGVLLDTTAQLVAAAAVAERLRLAGAAEECGAVMQSGAILSVSAVAGAAVPATRTLTAGAGLTGGGTLAADRTFAVGAGSGITVNADDVAVTFGLIGEMAAAGVGAANVAGGTAKAAAIDHAHAHGAQVLGDGTNHAVATGVVAGFMSATDKTDHDALQASRIQKRTITVGHADLTNAVNGSPQTIDIGSALPANARVLSVDAHTFTPFTGGGAASVAMDVGDLGDPNSLVTGADVFSAAVDGGPSTLPPGIRPNKTFVAGGVRLAVTFTPDGGASLDGLTAGSIIVDVLFVELA